MAVSGSKNFTFTRGDIIRAALRKIGAYDAGESVHGEEDADAAFALNMVIKEFSAHGMDIFVRQEQIVYLNPGQQQYQLGDANEGFDNYSGGWIAGYGYRSGYGFDVSTGTVYESALTADKTSAAGSFDITIPYIGGSIGLLQPLLDGDRLVLRNDNGTTHVNLVSNPANSGFAISADATSATYSYTGIGIGASSAQASTGNKIYFFRATADRPQEINAVYRRDQNGTDVPVTMIGEQEYSRLTRKGQTGAPTQVWHQQTLNGSTLHVWPTGDTGGFDRLVLQTQVLADDVDTTADNFEFPVEWGNVLIYQLANDLSPEYGVEPNRQARLYAIAQKKLNDLLDYSQENASVIFGLSGSAGRG